MNNAGCLRTTARVALIAFLLAIGLTGSRATAADPYEKARQRMVERQLKGRDIRDPRVLAAMGSVPRHEFVPERYRDQAYDDYPLPIGQEQTISQPYIVAFMTQALALKPGERVLEVGTGSGYQAAVLTYFTDKVFSVEIIDRLAREAAARLKRLGYDSVKVKQGDGYQGWPEYAPFDAIIITAAVDHVPQPLMEQLKMGGRIVLPLGRPGGAQRLTRITKTPQGPKTETLLDVRFVPMTGKALEK